MPSISEDGGSPVADEIIEEALSVLRSGRRLPAHLFPHLFETSKEYQLSYSGKARRADVLADTMAVPLQPVKTFGSVDGEWSNMLILGDNLQALRRLIQMKESGQLRNADGTDGVRLCYIDPPFASDREYQGAPGEKAYLDRVAGAEFVESLRRRLILMHELLADDGSLYVHLDEKKSHYVKVVLDEIFGEQNFQREIVWRIGWVSGFKSVAKNWIRNHDVILYYVKDASKRLFNKTYLPYVEGYERRGDDETEGKGYPIEDVWNANQSEFALVGTDSLDSIQIKSFSTEKTGFPTQKNESLARRIIEGSSNPGDIVLDCFCGSGTVAAAAEAASGGPRRWICVDSGKYAVYTTQVRLLRSEGGHAPFTLFNAGLYDYKTVKSLSWPDYREFALQLFQCRDAPETIAGVRFDGYLRDHPVLVFNFKEHPDAKIGEAFVKDLASVCKGRLGARCFIIAPALAVEPYEDYLDVDGTRFFFLRIPYSIIAELHKRAFSELRQPNSKEMMNETIDSVGFDFIQPPRVECRYEMDGDKLVVAITAFESEAYGASESADAITDLATVMVDYDYDGEIFDLDAVHWADDLDKKGWTFTIPAGRAGKQLMLIYLDVYGNEHRETKKPADFGAPKRHAKKIARSA
jgi:DNA modification methylase